MKSLKYIIGAVALTASTVAYGQQQTDNLRLSVPCYDNVNLTRLLSNYRELPLVRGKVDRLNLNDRPYKAPIAIFANPNTGSFSVVEQQGPDLFCITAGGDGFTAVSDEDRASMVQNF